MPYLNDVAEANAEQNQTAQLKIAVSRGTASRYLFEPDNIMDQLSRRIIGQDEQLSALHDMLHVVKADLATHQRPLSVMLFVGSTGVGKTETVRVLSELIHGSSDHLCRIDMNVLAQEHYAASLTGAPPGYVGSKEGHTLFKRDAIEGSYSRPGLVLFDEIEKADDTVIRTLLNICDAGVLDLSSGTQTLNFRNAMLFMTSNIGVRELAAYRRKFSRGWRRWLKRKPSAVKEQVILTKALETRFDPEFINRIDRVVYFAELETNVLKRLIGKEIEGLNTRVGKHGLSVKLDQAAFDYVSSLYDGQYGARQIKRSFRNELEPLIARHINQGAVKGCIAITCDGGKLCVR